jgi:Arc/MetJ family transcription regulator
MDEAFLVRTTGEIDNEVERTVWIEYRIPGQDRAVHRSVHVTLKRPAVFASGEIGRF